MLGKTKKLFCQQTNGCVPGHKHQNGHGGRERERERRSEREREREGEKRTRGGTDVLDRLSVVMLCFMFV